METSELSRLTNSSQEDVTLCFITPQDLNPEECSKLLKYAYQACREHGLNPQWLSTEECLKVNPTKEEVYVVDPFEGEAFDFLTSGSFKCVRVLGPRCLLDCLHSKKSVPELPSPLHNMAMHEIVITSTGYNQEEKSHLKERVERMSGIYSNNFHEGVTHLVAKLVGTKKYCVAAEKGTPIMTEEWINVVWKFANEQFDENVSALHERFSKYTCPVFRELNVCVSQLPKIEKEAIQDIIEKNGGIYSTSLQMNITSVLISPVADGQKYQSAIKWRIPCVTQDWIYDSLEAGTTLSWDAYKIKKKPKASTPTKNEDYSFRAPAELSICSTIMNESSLTGCSSVNETVDNDYSILIRKSPNTNAGDAGIVALEELDLAKSLRAGLFLDGCKIFTSGFDSVLSEKLRRILNAGGATRFSHPTDAVTHIIIGKRVEEHVNLIQSWNVKPHVVTADWLVACMNEGQPVDEDKFSYFKGDSNVGQSFDVTMTSPVHHRVARRRVPSEDNDKTVIDEDLINQYLANGERAEYATRRSLDCSTLPDSQQSVCGGIFKDCIFSVSGYPEDFQQQLSEVISENGGEMVAATSSRRVDFCVITLDGEGTVNPNATHCVTHVYIEDCVEQGSIIAVQYFHLPFTWPSSSPAILNGCVVGISTYKDKERLFIIHMTTRMGAVYQDSFAKKDNLQKNVKTNTHLICPEPNGNKYLAARKWEVPVVTKDWLLVCADKGYQAAEEQFALEGIVSPINVDHNRILMSLLRKSRSSVPQERRESMGSNDSLVSVTPINRKLKALKMQHNERALKEIKTPDLETMRRMYPTPGVRRENANDSLDALPTPDTPYGRTWFGSDPPPRIRKGIKRALDALPDDKKPLPYLGTPEEVLYERYAEKLKRFIANHPAPPKPPTFQLEASPERASEVEAPTEMEQGDAEDRSHGNETHADNLHPTSEGGRPLSSVVVYASRKLADTQDELYRVVESLGGAYRHVYDESVTHFIHFGRLNDTNREFRQARDDGKLVVAPDWVWMCRDERKRIDEALFPHTVDPKRTLSIFSTINTPVIARKKGRKQKTGEERTSHLMSGKEEEAAGESGEEGATTVETSKEELAKKVEEIETLTTGAVVAKRTPNAALRKRSATELHWTPTGGAASSGHRATANTESESQGTAITWDDPHDREARARLEGALEGNTQDILAQKQQNPDAETAEPVERDENPSSNSRTKGESDRYVFVFSNVHEKPKEAYSNIIISLGGSIVPEMRGFDSITHIIAERLTRSEKMVASIAAGKWILYTSFVEASAVAGHFVDEEEHEWGNEKAIDLPSFAPSDSCGKLAEAAFRWRLRLRRTGKGAFHRMVAVLFSVKMKIPPLTRCIEAGEGRVVTNWEQELDNITHCFVDNDSVSKVDLATFAARGIPCLETMYLSTLLITHPPPDDMENCVPEYKEIIANMTRSARKRIRRHNAQ